MKLTPGAQAVYRQAALRELDTALQHGTLMRPEHVAALLNMNTRELGYVTRKGGIPGSVRLTDRVYRYQASEVALLLKAKAS